MSAPVTILVGLAGALGALLRFTIDGAVMRRVDRALPFGTLVVNISAALLLGVLTGLTATTDVALIAGTGLMGGYSTFSTWMFESERLAEDYQARWTAANLLGSLVLGAGAIALGRVIGG